MSEQLVREWCQKNGATVEVNRYGVQPQTGGAYYHVVFPDHLVGVERGASPDGWCTLDEAVSEYEVCSWEEAYKFLTTEVYRRVGV